MSNILKPVPIRVLKRWTHSAKYCYEIGCRCSRCEIIEQLESIDYSSCSMKACVLMLVKLFGRPKVDNTSILKNGKDY